MVDLADEDGGVSGGTKSGKGCSSGGGGSGMFVGVSRYDLVQLRAGSRCDEVLSSKVWKCT